jgi:hypothetical protein
MGADITFEDEKGETLYYFRDSYNDTNLAHVIGFSYWSGSPKIILKDNKIARYKEFIIELSKITDKQIEEYYKKNFDDKKVIAWMNIKEQAIKIKTKRKLIKCLKDKRDDIKKNIDNITKATNVCWSV